MNTILPNVSNITIFAFFIPWIRALLIKNIGYIGSINAVICGFVIYFTASKAVGLFTDDPEVIKYGTMYLQITALMEPIYPIFFISNALIQGIKKANVVMMLTFGRMVFMPAIVLTYLIFYLESSFAFVFWGLLIINWIFGIFVLILTKRLISKEKNKIIKRVNNLMKK